MDVFVSEAVGFNNNIFTPIINSTLHAWAILQRNDNIDGLVKWLGMPEEKIRTSSLRKPGHSQIYQEEYLRPNDQWVNSYQFPYRRLP